jgi:hypothetical protein
MLMELKATNDREALVILRSRMLELLEHDDAIREVLLQVVKEDKVKRIYV